MTERYAVGYSDPRAIYTTGAWFPVKRYGEEFKMKVNSVITDIFGRVYSVWGKRYQGQDMKIDTHEYVTEAKTLDIQVIRDLWVVKYGDTPVGAEELANQDDFIWECGNRLFWAGYLTHKDDKDLLKETYSLLDKPCKS